jgi:hypothetical protein
VASAGDVNCDGYDDVIIGAPKYRDTLTYEGMVAVYYGSASGLPMHSPQWQRVGGQDGAYLGVSVASAGDVNQDGCSDVIVGAPLFSYAHDHEGGAWLFLGSPLGLSSEAANFDHGGQEDAGFGRSVGCAGDVNNDGYDDVFVTAPWYDNGQNNEGRIWVWHGSPTGISTIHDWRAESNQIACDFGWSAAGAGDVNGDGYDDLVVGANWYSNGEVAEGMALLWYGSASGVNNDVNGTPSNAAWTRDSNTPWALFGSWVSSAGDVNGDGFSDIIIGGPEYTEGQEEEGGAWLYHGSAAGPSVFSDNHDQGNQAFARFGFSVASAGDVDNDGYDEIVVGAPNYDVGVMNEGKMWLWLGSPMGVSALADWSRGGDLQGDNLGYSVASAGDVNGDGYGDVIVGAPFAGDGGMAFVFHGPGPSVFLDDFESGDTARWSRTLQPPSR